MEGGARNGKEAMGTRGGDAWRGNTLGLPSPANKEGSVGQSRPSAGSRCAQGQVCTEARVPPQHTAEPLETKFTKRHRRPRSLEGGGGEKTVVQATRPRSSLAVVASKPGRTRRAWGIRNEEGS